MAKGNTKGYEYRATIDHHCHATLRDAIDGRRGFPSMQHIIAEVLVEHIVEAAAKEIVELWQNDIMRHTRDVVMEVSR